MTERFSRRTFLHATAASTGIALLAGCSSSADTDSGENGDSDATTTADTESRDFGGWFDRTDNYDGVHDMTGKDTVSVTVGAEGNGGGYLAFTPAAVKVSPDTTVVWEWTGNGGTHNVVERENGLFESEITSTEGHTFEYTFEETGEYRYVCVPHEQLGMVGAVVVE
ncbi:halocyanin domain-containing protein [Haloferax mediterranei ATCC 33500]|uniref:Halocyanin n=1 Tax=Haloferax mediterranei (strain ATCC 33500 / DSM 1411 / JCM 8866 / NBRC 14739 / NCIMB 2177 / R-4) TaxID=523841 RepID=I3R3N3_HALMT|nr:halocyanin domain-containing protein [Haloferax mediterranei]AFK18843.1 halocyanin precursor-like protein [Haloferax mediterranei ATCC 33500]AHZ21792.1 halocyanin [Haloferax mediterranei ATCC 33500]EMA03299.1 halocyanin precursor-like protein [Haloferax mediterranei ATCC 33500]MDX5988936.1 halocyanin domain-containing protein [Haloferax mediterranei ATCC 33500]QCQ75331.1 halocyanin domain-containing protein [Haloferax mediterranei ATCC 33500]